MPDYHIPLLPGSVYHLVTRAVGSEKLFRSDNNYGFLLQRYQKHIQPVAETFAWCLLPNHLHLMVRIRPIEILELHFKEVKKNKPFHPEILPDFVMERFSNWLNSYTKSFNKMYSRKGSLFIDYLRRKEVKDDNQFRATVFYIHKNPVHHEYCKKISDWKWSSFSSLLSQKPTNLLRNEVIDTFDGEQGFIAYHNQPIYPKDALIVE
jgi:REP element-mobilizing transposase RayT